MHQLHRKEQGFTLLELLVVIVIIGLLAGYVAPRYFSQVGRPREIQVARAQIESLEKALDQYRLDMRRYPSTEEGLQALIAKPGDAQAWSGPYLKKAVPPDPWGRPHRVPHAGTKKRIRADLLRARRRTRRHRRGRRHRSELDK